MKKLNLVCNVTLTVPVPEGKSGEQYYNELSQSEVEYLFKTEKVRLYSLDDFMVEDVEEDVEEDVVASRHELEDKLWCALYNDERVSPAERVKIMGIYQSTKTK
jgi:hypothetical protein